MNAKLKQETQDSLFKKYRYAANNDNLIILNQRLADEKKYYQQSANIRHLYNQLILKQYIHNMTHLPYNQEDSKVLKNRPDNAYDAPMILKLTQGTIITFERCLV